MGISLNYMVFIDLFDKEMLASYSFHPLCFLKWVLSKTCDDLSTFFICGKQYRFRDIRSHHLDLPNLSQRQKIFERVRNLFIFMDSLIICTKFWKQPISSL